jgi:hypothetical protein
MALRLGVSTEKSTLFHTNETQLVPRITRSWIAHRQSIYDNTRYQAIKLSSYQAIKLSSYQAIKLSSYQAIMLTGSVADAYKHYGEVEF